MEYSAKYRVSLSTLRRRIKAGEIEHKLIEGKYLLKNGPPQTGSAGLETIAPPQPMSSQTQSPTKKASAAAAADKPQSPDQFWQTTQVRVLEDDNSRLKNSQPGLNLDLDLDLGLEA
jgi:hypothetical protein